MLTNSIACSTPISEPGVRVRFESRLKPFTGLGGEEVPAEFDELGPANPARA